MKKALLVITAALIALPLLTQAQSFEHEVTINFISQPLVYGRDFDVLMLDFTIETEHPDILETLTVKAEGNARHTIDYTKLTLWRDIGEPGFQGWGYDEKLGDAVKDLDFVFDNLDVDLAFPVDESGEVLDENPIAERFFVSLESGELIQDKILQLKLSQPFDDNGDQQWQEGDMGMFFQSGLLSESPIETGPTAFFKDDKFDVTPPKAFAEDLTYGETTRFVLDPDGQLVIVGQARDRNFGSVNEVRVQIGSDTVFATNTGTAFSTWQATFFPPTGLAETTLRVTALDGGGRKWDGPMYDVILDVREPSLDESTVAFSKKTVFSNGDDEQKITIILKDADGFVMPARNLSVSMTGTSFTRTRSGTTDEDGKLVLTETFEDITAQVQLEVTYDDNLVASGSFIISDEPPVVEPEPQPEPEQPAPQLPVAVGTLVKGSFDAVYYVSSLGQRHVFVTQSVYASWYGNDFSTVQTISDALLASIPLGEPVTYRPGTMLTAPSINEVYLVTRNQALRHISTESIAQALFGGSWNQLIYDLQESLLFGYEIGGPIVAESEIDLEMLQSPTYTIDNELAL